MMKMQNTVMSKLIAMLALLMLTLAIYPASADELSEPERLVKNASDDMMQALKDHKDELEQDPSKVYGLVDQILIPHFDFEKMAKLALGKNWRQASKDQRARFTEEFRLLLIRTYSTAMLQYSDQEIHLLPFRDDLSLKRVTVAMEIVQGSAPAIPMALSLYQNDDNDWKVYDVKIDGISLVTNYRSSFATEIRNDGMDKLIEDLAKRNEKVKA